MSKKIKKTLYLPDWIADILDKEGEIYDGPGIVAAASIHNFSTMDNEMKVSILQSFRSSEIVKAYLPAESMENAAADENAAASASSRSKRKPGRRRSSKSG